MFTEVCGSGGGEEVEEDDTRIVEKNNLLPS